MRDDDMQTTPAAHTRGRIVALLAHFRLLVRETGLRAAVEELVPATLGRVREKVYSRRTELALVKVLPDADGGGFDAAHPRPSAESQVRVERIGEHHAGDLVRLRTAGESFNPGQAANMLDHVRSGYQGFVLRRGEEIIGHFWWIDRRIAPRHPHLAEYHIALLDDDVYCFEYFIAPRHRGGGVATDALQAMEAHLREQGYRRVWGTVDADNTPARWLYLSNGWTVAHTVTSTRLLGRRRATVEDGA